MHLLIALALTTGFSTGYAQTLESRSAQLTRGIMEWLFSDGYVDIKCMWECARQWLPTEINPLGIDLIIGIPPNPDENCSTVLGFSSAQICHNSYSSMAFQRCYISVCGGLYTKIPEIPDSARQSGLSEDKKKLWSYISAYISNYSRGFAAFQGCNFGIYYSWAPMPIGITAACFSAPNQVFDQPDIKLMKMKQRLSTDGRLGVPQSIRRVLTPIWTSPSCWIICLTTLSYVISRKLTNHEPFPNYTTTLSQRICLALPPLHTCCRSLQHRNIISRKHSNSLPSVLSHSSQWCRPFITLSMPSLA